MSHVRYWHLADIGLCAANVRFWGKSGHDLSRCTRLLLTQSAHLRQRHFLCGAKPSRWMATFGLAEVMVDGDGRLVGDRFGDF